MATFKISTVSAGSVTLADLGNRTFTHPIVEFVLSDEYTMEDIRESVDLRTAIQAGTLTADLDGQSITSGALFDSIVEDFLSKRVADAEADIVTLQDKVAYLEKGGRLRKKVIDIVDCTAVPPTEVLGDRYILDFTAGTVNAAWDGALKGNIVEFNGTTWDAEQSLEGDITYVDLQDADYRYIDDGAPAWEKLDGVYEQNASQVPFTPTTPTDWDGTPTEVQSALDELADRVETLENAASPDKRSWSWDAGEDGTLSGDRDLRKTNNIPTNLSPFIAPIASTIWGISVANRQGDAESYSVQILKNDTVVSTHTISSADKGYNSALNLSLVAGDEVRTRFVIGGSGNVRDVSVSLFVKEV
jgi:hypothetical protein